MSRTPSSTAATVVKSSPPSPFSALTKAAASSAGIERRVGEQHVGQRLDARFARDLALGAALGLVRQVQVFQFLLGRRGLDGGAKLGRQLALLVDALEHRFAPVLEFAQVAQPVFQLAQLDVVQAAGGLLAVAGDEGDGGAAVEQVDRGLDLVFLDPDFGSDLPDDFLHAVLLRRCEDAGVCHRLRTQNRRIR